MVWMWGIIALWLLAAVAVISNLPFFQTAGWGWLLVPVIGMLALSTLQNQIRCPRCRLRVWSDGGDEPQSKVPGLPKSVCPCGRKRVWVFPLQYLIRPEQR